MWNRRLIGKLQLPNETSVLLFVSLFTKLELIQNSIESGVAKTVTTCSYSSLRSDWTLRRTLEFWICSQACLNSSYGSSKKRLTHRVRSSKETRTFPSEPDMTSSPLTLMVGL